MEYVNYSNKPCRVLIYDSKDYRNHIGMLKFNSLAQAFRALGGTKAGIGLFQKDVPPFKWQRLESVDSFRRHAKKHKVFRGYFYTDMFSNNRSFYFFSIIQA